MNNQEQKEASAIKPSRARLFVQPNPLPFENSSALISFFSSLTIFFYSTAIKKASNLALSIIGGPWLLNCREEFWHQLA